MSIKVEALNAPSSKSETARILLSQRYNTFKLTHHHHLSSLVYVHLSQPDNYGTMGAANAAEQEFNSSDGVSDDDWDRSRFQRNENIGARQVRSIIARQVEDRLESKRNARKLTVMHGAPGLE